MATRTFSPTSTLTAQVVTVTVGTSGGDIVAEELFGINIKGDDLDGDAIQIEAPETPTVEEVVDALVASPLWLDSRWTVAKASASTLTITSTTAGNSFYVHTTTASEFGTITAALTTPNSSPTDWNCAANWSGSAVPGDGDTAVLVEVDGGASITQGLLHDAYWEGTWVPSIAAVTLAAIKRNNSCNVAVGTTTYPLRIGVSAVSVGQPSGVTYVNGAFNVDLGTSAAVVNVYGSTGGVMIGLDSTSAELRVWSGATVTAYEQNNQCNKIVVDTSATLTGGSMALTGTTPSITNLGGIISLTNSDATNYKLIHVGGTTTLQGTATCSQMDAIAGTVRYMPDAGAAPVTTANVYGGTAYLVGNVTNLNIFPDAVADFLSATAALTVTNVTAYNGATYRIDPNVVTITNSPLTKSYEVTMQA